MENTSTYYFRPRVNTSTCEKFVKCGFRLSRYNSKVQKPFFVYDGNHNWFLQLIGCGVEMNCWYSGLIFTRNNPFNKKTQWYRRRENNLEVLDAIVTTQNNCIKLTQQWRTVDSLKHCEIRLPLKKRRF